MSRLHERLTSFHRVSDSHIRRGFEETKEIIRLLEDAIERLSRTNSTLQILGGGPPAVYLSFPFAISPSLNFYPNGIDIGDGNKIKIKSIEMVCDPEAAAPTGNTTFYFQDAASSPSTVAICTFASGSKRATASVNLTIPAGKRLYVKAPSELNGLQNLHYMCLVLEP